MLDVTTMVGTAAFPRNVSFLKSNKKIIQICTIKYCNFKHFFQAKDRDCIDPCGVRYKFFNGKNSKWFTIIVLKANFYFKCFKQTFHRRQESAELPPRRTPSAPTITGMVPTSAACSTAHRPRRGSCSGSAKSKPRVQAAEVKMQPAVDRLRLSMSVENVIKKTRN